MPWPPLDEMAAPTASRRLLFDPLRPDDAADLLRVRNSNPGFVEATLGAPRRAFRLEEVVAYLREELTSERDPALVPAICHHWLLRRRGDEGVVGVAELAFVHPHDQIPWIALLEISADQQGRGLAREAAVHLEQLAAARGHRRIGLNVLTANPPALRFWQHLGYELQGQPRGSGQGQAWALHKQLPTGPESWPGTR